MTKNLRLLLLTLLTVVFGTAWGGTITFADLGLENGQQYSDPFDGGDFTVTFVGGANDGKYYNTGSAIRVYGNGSMVVAAKSGNLKKIVITFFDNASNQPESADIVDTGTYDLESHTWTGQSATVTFTRPTGSGHWRIQAVEATVEAGAVVEKQTPTMSFSPASLTITKGAAFMKGDVNCDGIVNVGDVTTLISYILGNDPQPVNVQAANFNGDGSINVADVTALITYILNI